MDEGTQLQGVVETQAEIADMPVPCAPCEAKRQAEAALAAAQESNNMADGSTPAVPGVIVIGGAGLTREQIEVFYRDAPAVKDELIRRLDTEKPAEDSDYIKMMRAAGFGMHGGTK